jgi:hypothetical protein
MTTAPAETSPRTGWSVSSLLAIVLAAIVAGVACFRQIYENDVGWHLALGRIFATNGLKFENGLAWTARHERWYPTSWLFDWLSWKSYAAFGPAGAQGFTLLLLLLVIAGLVVALRGARAGGMLFVLPATMLLLVPRISPRPHVATWVILAGTLAFARLAKDRSWHWRIAAIPLIALGSNLHQGAGLATGVLGLFCIEAGWREKQWVREGAIALGGVLALLAIPGGVANVLSIRDHLHLDDVLQLIEYKAPTLTGPQGQPVFFVCLALFALAAWKLWREEPANIVAAAVVVFMAFAHGQRWIFEFFILLAPLLALLAPRLGAVSPGLFVGLFTLIAVGSDYREAPHFVVGTKWDRASNPVRAAQFLKDEGITGRFFNSYHDGGYLALEFPVTGVYMDSRPLAYPPGFFSNEMKVESQPAQFLKQMRANDIEFAITGNYGKVLSGMRMFDSPEWALVYWDEVNEVYLRRDVPRFQEKIARLEFKYFKPPDLQKAILGTLTGIMPPPEVMTQYSSELDRFDHYTPGAYYARWARCLVATRRRDKGVNELCEGL